MKLKKIISTAVAVCLLLGASACANDDGQRELTEKELKKISSSVPDYSDNNQTFEFFAYSSARNGYWYESGVEYYAGRDLYSVEDIALYKGSGLTFMHPQHEVAIAINAVNFHFETSELKRFMDNAVTAEMARVIVPDYRINGLISEIKTGLEAYASNDENVAKAYQDEKDLFTQTGEIDQDKVDEYILSYTKDYSKHPAFYGIVLPDEPNADRFPAYGIVYRTIKRLYPDAFLLCNILPPAGFNTERLGEIEVTAEDEAEFAHTTEKTRFAQWKKYINYFLDETGVEYLMYDQYPLSDSTIHGTYLRGLQIAAQTCKERGIDFYFVTQSCGLNSTRVPTKEDAAWLNNMLLGMGVKTIGYYTYCPRDVIEQELMYKNFVDYFGNPTETYYIMQEIFAQNQQFASTILSFDYTQSSVIAAANAAYTAQYIQNATTTGEFAKLASVEVDKESALITELYDSENMRYMYMVQNIVDTKNTNVKSWQQTTLSFGEEYQYAVVWSNGETSVIKLKDNQYTITQHPGQAVYVIPFNA